MFKLRLHTQLLVLAAVPMLGFVLLSARAVHDAWRTVEHMRAVGGEVRQIRGYDALMGVLRVERGRSNGWQGAQRGGAQAEARKDEMAAARRDTGQLLARGGLPELPSLQTQLERLRAAIDGRESGTGSGAAFERYSALIQQAMERSGAIMRAMRAPALADAAQASLALSSLTEEAARERGLLNGMIAAGAYGRGERDRIVAAVANQARDERQFLMFAPPALRDSYLALRDAAPWRELLRLRAAALDGAPGALDAGQWFAAASARIGMLEKLQAAQLDAIGREADALLQAAQRGMRVLAAAVALALVGTIGLLLAIGRRILRRVGGDPEEVAEMARSVARGELGHAAALRPGDRSSILAAMHHMAGTLSRLLAELQRRAAALGDAASQLNGMALSISHSTQQQASTIEETSTAMRTVSEAISQNNEHAMQTATIANKCGAEAREGCMAMSFTVAAMRNVAVSVRNADEIAYRTNLLALNAGIEAGRAGLEGKGFAVIASEVRRLAEHAHQAAQEVSEITGQTLDTAEKAGEMLNSLLPSIINTAELVTRISDTSQQQARDLAQINVAVEQFSGSLQYNADTSERLFLAAQEMQRQAEGLLDLVQFFRTGGAQPV